MYCINCGNKLDDGAIFCSKCGIYTDDYIKNKDDKPSFILEFFSFFVPLFGLIMYLSLNNSKPNRACLCGKFALFGFIVNILIFVITFIGIVIHGGSIPGVYV